MAHSSLSNLLSFLSILCSVMEDGGLQERPALRMLTARSILGGQDVGRTVPVGYPSRNCGIDIHACTHVHTHAHMLIHVHTHP